MCQAETKNIVRKTKRKSEKYFGSVSNLGLIFVSKVIPHHFINIEVSFLFEIILSVKYNGKMTIHDFAKTLGRRGGQSRAKRLSSERKKAIASLGGQARALSLKAAQRILENFRYIDVLQQLNACKERPSRLFPKELQK